MQGTHLKLAWICANEDGEFSATSLILIGRTLTVHRTRIYGSKEEQKK